MITFDHTITDSAGLHARPAGLLVKALQPFQATITVARGEKSVSAKKLFALMGLALKCGETITIAADGPDEVEAIAAVRGVLTEEGI
jgi:phosphotransferase system HPr (HPr) family protein